MSFRERSAWAMAAVMIVTGLIYLNLVREIPADAPPTAQLGPLVPYVLLVSIASIVAQVGLAAMAPNEAKRPADERERVAIDKAGYWAGKLFAVGAVGGAIGYLLYGSGRLLFVAVIASLIVAQLVEYLLQIVLFRRAY